ncbi:MAG: cation diffusion facilitator family transporter [Acidimicrobiia bacterium]
MHEGSRKAIIAAFFANLGIAIAKFAGFLITASAGLLAEAGHSLADTGNQALLILGGKRAARRSDQEHPFGYGRERYFWAFVVALVLFSMGGLFALYEGIEKVRHPHETENLPVAIGILVFAILLETYSLRTAVREARHVKLPGTSWWQFIRGSKSPELPVVLLEDVGAEIGLFLALFGVLLAHFTEEPRWDAVGSIAIGVLLVLIAIVLAIEMKALLIGESATADAEEAIVSAMTGSTNVERLIHLKTQHLGPDELLVGAKLEFAHDLSLAELASAINGVEAATRKAVPSARVIYIEPDIYVAPTS